MGYVRLDISFYLCYDCSMSNKNNNKIATLGSVLAMFVFILIPFKSFAYVTQGAYTVYDGGGTNNSNYISNGGNNAGYNTSGGSNTPQVAQSHHYRSKGK
jgi:hypothetical protein